MTPLYENFHWYEPEQDQAQGKTPQERYRKLVDWASQTRGLTLLLLTR